MTPLQKIQRSHVQLMRSKEFCMLSGILLCGRVSIGDSVATAATDGWNVTYNPEFMGALNDKEHAFVVAHENFHKMLRQLSTWRVLFKTDAKRANMAADYVINQMIVDLDPQRTVVSPPECILLDARYRGMDTKQVFDLLGEQPPDGRGGAGDGAPLDDHQWELAGAVSAEEHSEREAAIDSGLNPFDFRAMFEHHSRRASRNANGVLIPLISGQCLNCKTGGKLAKVSLNPFDFRAMFELQEATEYGIAVVS